MCADRSLVHLVNLFATRMEVEHAPLPVVNALKLYARDRTIRKVERRDGRFEEETRRIERQRTLTAMCPSTNSVDRLKEAMLQRAYDLLWDGDPGSCDALLEFLPESMADKMLEAWSRDFEGETPKSRFYQKDVP